MTRIANLNLDGSVVIEFSNPEEAVMAISTGFRVSGTPGAFQCRPRRLRTALVPPAQTHDRQIPSIWKQRPRQELPTPVTEALRVIANRALTSLDAFQSSIEEAFLGIDELHQLRHVTAAALHSLTTQLMSAFMEIKSISPLPSSLEQTEFPPLRSRQDTPQADADMTEPQPTERPTLSTSPSEPRQKKFCAAQPAPDLPIEVQDADMPSSLIPHDLRNIPSCPN